MFPRARSSTLLPALLPTLRTSERNTVGEFRHRLGSAARGGQQRRLASAVRWRRLVRVATRLAAYLRCAAAGTIGCLRSHRSPRHTHTYRHVGSSNERQWWCVLRKDTLTGTRLFPLSEGSLSVRNGSALALDSGYNGQKPGYNNTVQ